MSLTRLDETWLRTVAEHALRLPAAERSHAIVTYCKDPELSTAIEETLGAYSANGLEPGGALAGPLWNDLLALLDDGESGATDQGGHDASRLKSPDADAIVAEGARFGRLGRLRVERLLSSGGMGRIYEAYDELLQRRVALKTLYGDHRLSPWARARFLREARLSSRLDHPHVCRLYDLIEDDGVEALVLELIEGQSLAQRMKAAVTKSEGSKADSALEHREKLRIASEIAAGLAAAHEAEIIHRDLKPANIMLSQEGTVKIVDFGIARAEESPAALHGPAAAPDENGFSAFKTRHGTTLGTLPYMSPEQARCETVGPETDIFSFGLVLRELFTGTKAYRFNNPAHLWSKVAASEIAGYDQIDTGLRAMLDRMLAPDASHRPSALQVGEQIESLRHRGTQRRRYLIAAAAAILIGASFLMLRPAQEEKIFSAGKTPRVAVLPIENRSGEAGFAWVRWGLTEMVSDSLEATAGLEVIDFQEVRELAQRLNAEVDVDAAVEALGADLVLRAQLEPVKNGLYQLAYRMQRVGFTSRQRTATGVDPFAAASEMAASTTRRLAPEALLPDLRELFSGDPFVNQLFAHGLDLLRDERGPEAEHFLRAALQLDDSSIEARLRLADALNLQNKWPEATRVLQAVIAAAADRQTWVTDAYSAMSTNALGRDERQEAAAWGEKAVQAAEASGERGRLALALYTLARTLRFLDPERAQAQLERALKIQREKGNRLGEAKSRQLQGVILDERGEEEAATEKFTEALAIAQEIDAIRLEGVLLDSLSIISIQTGQMEEARDLLTQAVELTRQVGDRRALIFMLNNLGDVYQELEEAERAEETLREAEAICGEIDAPNPCALLAFNFAELLILTERPAEALPLIERSESFYGVSDPDNIWLRSISAAASGLGDEAQRRLEEACRLSDEPRCQAYREGFAQVAGL